MWLEGLNFRPVFHFFPTIFISVWQNDVTPEFSPASCPSVLLVRMPSENKPPTSGPSQTPMWCLSQRDLQSSASTLQLFSDRHGFPRLTCCSNLTSFFQSFPALRVKEKNKGLWEIVASLYVSIYFRGGNRGSHNKKKPDICSRKMASGSRAILKMHFKYFFL